MIDGFFSIPILYEVIPKERNTLITQETERALIEERKVANNDVWNNEIDTTFHKTESAITKYGMSELNNVLTELTGKMIKAMTSQYEKTIEYDGTLHNSWFNIGQPGSFQFDHFHHGWEGHNALSGVYYYKVPKGSGAIMFKSPIEQLTLCNKLWDIGIQTYFDLVPSEGSVVIFPSFLKHKVGLNQSNEERISLSFNIGLNIIDKE